MIKGLYSSDQCNILGGVLMRVIQLNVVLPRAVLLNVMALCQRLFVSSNLSTFWERDYSSVKKYFQHSINFKIFFETKFSSKYFWQHRRLPLKANVSNKKFIRP